ncbi:MAG TPA: OmpH family outer membrane protein [Rhizobacter sp.]|jgi:outer membrane protein|nr:OmpH family outer membrane protein [Rhizobacter sp.]
MVSATCLVVAAWGAQAQEMKIGYVNSDKVLRDALPARAAYTKIEAEFGKRDKDLTEMSARLKAAADKLDKEGPTLAESERVRRQRELVDQDREIQRKRREYQEDLNQRRNEEMASLVDRANKIIKQIADQDKYDLIVQEVIFASSRIDITEKVIKALNAQGGK